MNTLHVIILAQGVGHLITRASLLKLETCANVAVLRRTLMQINAILAPHRTRNVTVVAWADIVTSIGTLPFMPTWVTMPKPDVGPLAGIATYLESTGRGGFGDGPITRASDTVVLFGDTVYSWRVLRELLTPSSGTPYAFSGTADLDSTNGHIWGVRWSRAAEPFMIDRLSDAVAEHVRSVWGNNRSGLRQWLWQILPSKTFVEDDLATAVRIGVYDPVDSDGDYTSDVDTQDAAMELFDLSLHASEDDALHGVRW